MEMGPEGGIESPSGAPQSPMLPLHQYPALERYDNGAAISNDRIWGLRHLQNIANTTVPNKSSAIVPEATIQARELEGIGYVFSAQ